MLFALSNDRAWPGRPRTLLRVDFALTFPFGGRSFARSFGVLRGFRLFSSVFAHFFSLHRSALPRVLSGRSAAFGRVVRLSRTLPMRFDRLCTVKYVGPQDLLSTRRSSHADL